MTLSYRDIAQTQLDFLLFQQVEISTSTDFRRWFIYVLVVTWLVGIGRYWDHPSAEVWQYFGLGSVVYIFGLSSLLYVVVLPLRPANWQFRGVLIFVGLTSLPALLYAVPVERFMDLETAKSVNAWFLGLVAAWRVALLLRFLNKSARLSWALVTIVAVMLLSGIVVTLSILNLEHVVFDIMAGIRDENASPNDLAYLIVLNLSLYSIIAFPIALIAYLVAIPMKARSNDVD